MPKAPASTRFDDPDGKKPNPNGLYNRDGFMDRVPGKASSFTKPPAVSKPTKSTDQMALEKAASYDKMLTAKRAKKK
jgi:hypothetical protein